MASLIGPTTLSAEPPVSQDPEVVDSKAAREAIQRVIDAYRKYTTFASQSTSERDYQVEPPIPDGRGQEGASHRNEFAFKAPGQFRITSNPYIATSDGRTLWVHNPQTHQYLEVPRAEVGIWLNEWLEEHTDRRLRVPTVGRAMLDRQADLDDVFASVARFIGVRPEHRDGQPGRWVIMDFYDDSYFTQEYLRLQMWVDDETNQVKASLTDSTVAYQASLDRQREQVEQARQRAKQVDEAVEIDEPPKWKVKRLKWASTTTNIKVDQPLAAEMFTFTPGPEDKRVESFSARVMQSVRQADQIKLIGQEAPAIHGSNLDGKEIDLSHLADRVVLLDFWATWCGPCVMAIPHVQQISEHFADKPVTVLGINRDRPGDDAKVRKFVKDKKITFDHILDMDGGIAQRYYVTGIPCMVLIDQKGVVQSTQTGFAPSHREELIEQIDELLAGGSLLNEERLGEKLRQANAADEERTKRQKEMELKMRFGFEMNAKLLDLIGKEAPAFDVKDIAGRQIKSSDLKGRALLLNFWMAHDFDDENDARLSSPERYLRSIQRVARRFDEREFAVVGVITHTRWTPPEDIAKWTNEQRITFPQVVDEGGSLAELYHVRSYPTRVLIDAQGVVQDIAVGSSHNVEHQFHSQIQKLIKGEALIDQTELEDRKSVAKDEPDQVPGHFGLKPLSVATEAPDRLQLLHRWGDEALGYKAMEFDVDSDGKSETVLFGSSGISILEAGESDPQRIRLKPKAKGNYQIDELAPVRTANELLWFVSITSWGVENFSNRVGMYGSDGRELWAFNPPKADAKLGEGEMISNQANIAAGDLDGDGSIELLAVINYVQWSKPKDEAMLGNVGHHSAAHLFVLSSDGQILSQTDLGDSGHLIHVIPPVDQKGQATILCSTTKGLRHYKFGGPDEALQESKETSNR